MKSSTSPPGEPNSQFDSAPPEAPFPASPIAGQVPPTPRDRHSRLPADWQARSVEGFLLGALFSLCVCLLGINGLTNMPIQEDILLLPGLIGALVALTRARPLLRIATCASLALAIIVGYTPLVNRLMPSLLRADPLGHVPAVVVISTGLHKDGALNAAGQERFIHGYLLMKQGFGDTMVLTRAVPNIGDQSPVVMAQIRELGLNLPVERVGPVVNTHDEAVLTAQLARAHGWKRVILVTHPWHMRRARAVFVKAGIDVLCSPCVEGSYDMSSLDTPRGRFAAWANWMHETIGYQVYRLRGWL